MRVSDRPQHIAVSASFAGFGDGLPSPVNFEAGADSVTLEVVDAQTDGYQGKRNADGTWDILNVPFFSAHVDERGPVPERYSVGWLVSAVKLAQQREQTDGYLGPLHVQHHTPGNNDVSFAGKIRLNGVKALRYEGRPTPTIFGDLVQIPDEVYQDIKGGQLPYRSVEIHGPESAEILSLALLDHEVPYFRYSVMQIKREVRQAKRKSRSLVAFRASGINDQGQQTRSLTFNYQQGQGAMADTIRRTINYAGQTVSSRLKSRIDFIIRSTVPDLKRRAAANDIEAVLQTLQILASESASMLQAAKAEAQKQRSLRSEGTMATDTATFASDATDEDEDETKAKAFQDGDPAALVGEIIGMLQKLADALGGGGDEETEEETEAPPVMASQNTPVETRQAEAPAAPATPAAAPAEASSPLGTAIGRIAALEAQLAGYQATSQEQHQISERDTAALAFAQGGASGDDVDTFRMLWEQNGQDSARAFAESMSRTFAARPKSPPRTFAGDLPGRSSAADLIPEEVKAYEAHGPKAYAEAQRWYAAWENSSKRHTLRRYLAAQLDSAQFFTAGAAAK